jgi:hypothetical protein
MRIAAGAGMVRIHGDRDKGVASKVAALVRSAFVR